MSRFLSAGPLERVTETHQFESPRVTDERDFA